MGFEKAEFENLEKEVITSTGNGQVKQLIGLQKKARERRNRDVFLVEGMKMFREAPAERIEQIYVSQSFYQKNRGLLEGEGVPGAARITLLSDRVFGCVSDTQTPQGILCLIRQYHYTREDLLGQAPLVLALENLQDPGNLGTILRTAEGAGVTGILLSGGCVDVYNSKVIRSTMGSVYRVPFVYSEDWTGDLNWLRAQGLRLYAAHLKGTLSYDQQTYAGACGFLIGNESQGLTEETAALADAYIRIPMCGQVESLNAAVAAALLMYEANRQRRRQTL